MLSWLGPGCRVVLHSCNPADSLFPPLHPQLVPPSWRSRWGCCICAKLLLLHPEPGQGPGPGHSAQRLCSTLNRRCCGSVQLEDGGMDALVALGCGDMRRSLNILQASLSSTNCRNDQAMCCSCVSMWRPRGAWLAGMCTGLDVIARPGPCLLPLVRSNRLSVVMLPGRSAQLLPGHALGQRPE